MSTEVAGSGLMPARNIEIVGPLPCVMNPHTQSEASAQFAARPDLFTPGFVERPFWREGVDLDLESPRSGVPSSADVVVIGGGYTGLSAAATTAAAGRSTVVLEAKSLGAGCSGLNGGQVSASLKPTLTKLSARFGGERALAVHREGILALERLREFIDQRSLKCDWQPVGSFVGAHSPKHFEGLRKRSETLASHLGISTQLIERRDQHLEIETRAYYGGLVYPRHAAVHPAKLLRELYRVARESGVGYVEHSPATAVKRDGRGFLVQTPRGTVAARNVIIATNGYTGAFSPWHRRRVIPIGSQIVATEPLQPDLTRTLLPTGRVILDTRRIVVYYRPSPDGSRILFGGRATLSDTPAMTYAPKLVGWLRRIFPQLDTVRITHAWAGTVAYTFDELPHLGQFDGVHYCMGYCGSGVALSTYFGRKIGQQVLGRPEGATALDGIAFQTRPLYSGYPWFLAPSILIYRVLDSLKI